MPAVKAARKAFLEISSNDPKRQPVYKVSLKGMGR
jgi:hypothetical protein